GARALFATDVTYRKGKDVPLLGIVSQAIADAPTVERVVVLRRTAPTERVKNEVSWQDFLAAGAGHDDTHVELEANEPAYILATSGTTAKPKLAVHTHGGYQVYVYSMGKWMFGLGPTDIWWSTSDIGWVVGHSYIVFGPLLVGCTTIAYEGALDHPNAETFYAVVERNKVTGVFTSPTAARLLMRYGVAPAREHDLSSLERVFCAGEVLNAPAWEWLQKEALQDRVPVIDHYWQTETGGPVVGNPYGIATLPIKPGSGGVPLAGIEAAVVDQDGKELGPDDKGIFVIKRPFPGLTARLWAEPERYACGPCGDRRAQLRRHAAEDSERQDHAARAEGGDTRQGPGRHLDDRGRGLGRGSPRVVAADEIQCRGRALNPNRPGPRSRRRS